MTPARSFPLRSFLPTLNTFCIPLPPASAGGGRGTSRAHCGRNGRKAEQNGAKEPGPTNPYPRRGAQRAPTRGPPPARAPRRWSEGGHQRAGGGPKRAHGPPRQRGEHGGPPRRPGGTGAANKGDRSPARKPAEQRRPGRPGKPWGGQARPAAAGAPARDPDGSRAPNAQGARAHRRGRSGEKGAGEPGPNAQGPGSEGRSGPGPRRAHNGGFGDPRPNRARGPKRARSGATTGRRTPAAAPPGPRRTRPVRSTVRAAHGGEAPYTRY